MTTYVNFHRRKKKQKEQRKKLKEGENDIVLVKIKNTGALFLHISFNDHQRLLMVSKGIFSLG